MISPYLLRPLRSLQEAVEGARLRDAARGRGKAPDLRRTLKAEGPGVQFWDSRAPAGPRLVWTNATRQPKD